MEQQQNEQQHGVIKADLMHNFKQFNESRADFMKRKDAN